PPEIAVVEILLPAEVEPRVRELVDEQRRVLQERPPRVRHRRLTFPCPPCVRRQRVRARPQCEQVQDRVLAEAVPPRRQELPLRPALRLPPHRQCLAAGEHPRPIHPLVQLRRQPI